MAVVYRARDTALDRVVAVKVLHGHLQTQADSRSRLTREAQAVAKLRHPNIVDIYDTSGEDGEIAFLVTEFIQGETLEAFLQHRKLRLPETALLLATPICEALAHAHALGVVHRDIKPGNVMIREDGTIKLMDFGIAQVLDAQGLTLTGTLLGSPAHMSPEHIEGRPLDARADVFSLGTLLYLATVGELPFQGRNPHALMRALLEGEVRRPSAVNPRVSAPIERLLLHLLEREPQKRVQSVDLVLAELRALLASVGVVDLGRELRDFWAAPDAYEAALEQRLVRARLTRGQEALLAGRHAAAMEELNHVLALEPRNPEVHTLLRRLGRRRAWARGAMAATVFSGLAGLTYWLWPAREAVQEPLPTPAGAAGKADSVRAAVPVALPTAPPSPPRTESPRIHAAAPAPSTLAARDELESLLPEPPEMAEGTRALRPPLPQSDATAAPGSGEPGRSTAPDQASTPEARSRTSKEPRKRRALATLGERRVNLGDAPASPAEPERHPEPVAVAPVVTPPAAPEPLPEPPPIPQPTLAPLPPRTLRINTWPKAVRILIDGKELGWAGIVDRAELTPGAHVVRLESPSCHPQELRVNVPADGPVPALVARLAWKPGLLIVESGQNPDVAVDGVYKGNSERTGKEPILVPIEAQNRLGRIKVHLRVSKSGFQQEDRVVELAAGRSTRVNVSLQPQ